MIRDEAIREHLEEELIRRGLFLVEAAVKPVNRIIVYIDSMAGVTLEECMSVSRYLEKKLDREVEDFELEVSSPGLDRPLKLPVQYEKNTGRMLDVLKTDGMKVTGKLLGISTGVIQLQTETTEKNGKTGKKTTRQELVEIKLQEIKTAKVIISLKK